MSDISESWASINTAKSGIRSLSAVLPKMTRALGDRTGRALARDEIVDAVERILATYVDRRSDAEETFLQTYRRIGMAPFKERIYAAMRAEA